MSIPRSAYLFITMLNFVCYTVEAQRIIERQNIELITSAEGLPFSSITGVLQDHTGFLWISSLDGLARYDGYSFLKISNRYLPDQSIGVMTMDRSGNLWLGHLAGSVTRFNPLTLEAATFAVPGARNADVTTVHCDNNGRVWCSARNTGIFVLDSSSTFRFVAKAPDYTIKDGFTEKVMSNNVGAILLRNDTLWIGTAEGLYMLKTGEEKLQLYSLLHEGTDITVPVQAIHARGSTLWIGTYGSGLIEFNIASRTWKNYKFQKHIVGTTNIVNAIAETSAGNLWLATNGKGIGHFNFHDRTLSFYYEPDDFNWGPLTNRIIEGRNGIVWASSDKGLHKWNVQDSKFVFTSVVPVRSDNGSYYGVSVVLDTDKPKRKILGVSFADGLHIVDENGSIMSRDFDVLPNAEPYKIVTDLLQDRSGYVWVLTRDFLYRLTEDNRLVKESGINLAMPKGTVPYFYRMLETSNGDLMVASSREGVFIKAHNAKRWKRITSGDTTLLSNRVVRMLEDDNKKVWMLHPMAGITRFDLKTRHFDHLTSSPDTAGLQSTRLTDMSKSPDGSIWVSSLEGIAVFKNASEDVLTLSKNTGLPSNVVYSLCADDYGVIWVSTSLGVSAILPSGQVRTFDHLDGLGGVNATYTLRRGQEGKMNILTYRGYFTFDPKTILEESDHGYATRITRLHVNDKPIETFNGKEIHLSYSENFASFEFSAMNFRNPQRNLYAYKMDGLENDWKETSQHSVNYSGLPSGSYTFRVKLAGQEDNQAAVLNIHVETPYWRTTWFIGVIIVSILGFLFLLYWLRLRFIRKEEQMKASLNQQIMEVEMKALRAQMSPHFIFNSLNSINRYIVKSDPETASNYLTKFSKLMRLILENSNHKVVTLEQELNALKLYIELEALRFNNKFKYKLTVDRAVDATTVGVPPMIIQPFIENAIWHGLLHKETPGQLEVLIEAEDESIRCTIIDDGIGRRRAAELKSKSVSRDKSYGMKITKDRLNIARGSTHASTVEIVDLESDEGIALGTKVIVTIPITQLEPEF